MTMATTWAADVLAACKADMRDRNERHLGLGLRRPKSWFPIVDLGGTRSAGAIKAATYNTIRAEDPFTTSD